ncbi:MAG: hypothetical protein CL760_00385 [Chloroflexi bacterium]|nr:hypothetical protein [Chloroflexota bacterium]|tara:strand:+ start:29245 stop:29739 length:495 start_codon:yes stop_codon:yes gene_type:complete
MQKGFNQVILIGNLASDPEIREIKEGNKAVTLSVVTSETWKDKETGEIKENPQFHRVVGFGSTATFASYLKKGQPVQVVGMLTHRKYTNNEGKDVYITEVMINPMSGGQLQGIGGRRDGEQAAAPSKAAPSQPAKPQSAPEPQQAAPQPQSAPPVDDDDDDIPF